MKDNLSSSIIKTINSLKLFTAGIIVLLFFLYVCTGIYSISQNEIGVLLLFGKIVNDRVSPGIHFSFPWPINSIKKVPVKIIKNIVISDFFQQDFLSSNNPLRPYYDYEGMDPYCITGDNNIVNINCGLQYSISNPKQFLFSVSDPERFLYDLTCNTINHCLAILSVDKTLTYGKREIENYIKNNVQDKLDSLNCGLTVSFVELKSINPPRKVQKYFDDVINSKIDQKKMRSNAESYRNEQIPQANTVANQSVEKARSYQLDVIAKAEGDTSRFIDTLLIYKETKSTTRKKLYLEFIKDVLSEIDEIYIISNKNNNVPAKIKLLK